MQEYLLCKQCKKRPICIDRSKFYCFHCLDARYKANRKYDLAHRKENYARTKRWCMANPEKSRENNRKFMENLSLEKLSQYKNIKKAWKQSESGKASSHKYYETHKDAIREYHKIYLQKNKESIAQRIKKWSGKNRDKISGYTKKYNSLHPEKVTQSSRNRREIFKNVIGTFTLDDWKNICNTYGDKCLWCERTDRKLTIDHVVPITRGGTNFPNNLQPLCANCNSKKGTRILDFRPFGSTIMEWT